MLFLYFRSSDLNRAESAIVHFSQKAAFKEEISVLKGGAWIMGRVTKTYPDKKGLVRSVQLKTKTGHLERPISKLFLLKEAV